MAEKEIIELKELIEKSIFSENEKKELLSMVDSNQVGDGLFGKIEDYFSEYLRDKQEEYQKGISKMDQGFSEIDKLIQGRMQELERTLETKLSEVNISDTKKRAEIWKKYYQSLKDLNEEHEDMIKKFSSSALVSMV